MYIYVCRAHKNRKESPASLNVVYPVLYIFLETVFFFKLHLWWTCVSFIVLIHVTGVVINSNLNIVITGQKLRGIAQEKHRVL